MIARPRMRGDEWNVKSVEEKGWRLRRQYRWTAKRKHDRQKEKRWQQKTNFSGTSSVLASKSVRREVGPRPALPCSECSHWVPICFCASKTTLDSHLYWELYLVFLFSILLLAVARDFFPRHSSMRYIRKSSYSSANFQIGHNGRWKINK